MDHAASLREVLFDNPRFDPAALAILADGVRMTHSDLRRRVGAVAAALARDGLAPGDRVAVLLENRPEFLECYFAVTALGAIFVPLNWRLHSTEHVTLMQDSQPRVLVAALAFAGTARRAQTQVASLKRIVSVDGVETGLGDYHEWSKLEAGMPPASGLGRDTPASILYTSGTTSTPKGVVLTHGNYLADFRHVQSVAGMGPGDMNLQLSPLYHAAGVHSFVHLAFGGATILDRKFDPAEALALIERERVTYFFAVPTMLYQMMDHPDFHRRDLSSLRTISYGAAGITRARLEEAMAAFGPKLIHAYGMTETTSHSSLLRAEEHAMAFGSVGRELGDVEIRLLDAEGRACGTDVVGEILIRGPHVMQGYWQRPEATHAAFMDGWLRTGDLGRRDARGFLYVVDRMKDLVISGGVNIYPREIEDVISACPEVAEVAVFGVPDPHWGEALVAAVALRAGARAGPQDILAFCRERIGGYKIPKRVEVLGELPRNASGKILKTELRKVFSA